jgi:hypothetical protein
LGDVVGEIEQVRQFIFPFFLLRRRFLEFSTSWRGEYLGVVVEVVGGNLSIEY